DVCAIGHIADHWAQGLRIYHDAVIVGDVDELVITDPAVGTLPEVLQQTGKADVITPIGLELIHRPSEETEALGSQILATRRHVRLSALYSKPCIVKGPTRLSRGGHYATSRKLEMPVGLYLLHLKHADRELYTGTMDRRNSVADGSSGVASPKDAMIGRHWFSKTRNDQRWFDTVDAAPVTDGVPFDDLRTAMQNAWRPRPKTEFWEIPGDITAGPLRLHRLPDRFKNAA
ncbi:MAG: hypothetical protein AAGF71_13285, partial [Pseudomonadota bacterium]